jgi:two-component system phosphate regulon sensor histidine kinase PhoR
MRWRNSLLFVLVLCPALALGALVGLVFFSTLPPAHRPDILWYGVVTLGVVASVSAIYGGLCVRRRLAGLREFMAVAPEGESPPLLPVWNEDELGALEKGVQRFVTLQHERLRTLQGERRKLEAVLQSMAEGVVVIDLDGDVVLCNRAAQDQFDLSAVENWQGKPIQEFSRDPILHELLREVASNRPTDHPLTRELEVENKKPRSLEVSAMQICEDRTTTSGYVLVFHEITQLKRLESIRADFVANVSHELRTPLTAIKGYAETLLNGALRDPETARRFLTIIDRHSERLSRLIEDLLTLSNLELGKTELRYEEVLLPELVAEVFEVVKEKAQRGRVTLVEDLSSDLPSLSGDGDRLHQVLINLIDNAVKYTPAGGTVTVTARTAPSREVQVQHQEELRNGEVRGSSLRTLDHAFPQEWIKIAVTDTGCGIPASEIPRLTQRFYRVDKARSRELGGTGLGLAIVKHIVQAHGGLLRIDSQMNQGTTVCIWLPRGTSPSLITTDQSFSSALAERSY